MHWALFSPTGVSLQHSEQRVPSPHLKASAGRGAGRRAGQGVLSRMPSSPAQLGAPAQLAVSASSPPLPRRRPGGMALTGVLAGGLAVDAGHGGGVQLSGPASAAVLHLASINHTSGQSDLAAVGAAGVAVAAACRAGVGAGALSGRAEGAPAAPAGLPSLFTPRVQRGPPAAQAHWPGALEVSVQVRPMPDLQLESAQHWSPMAMVQSGTHLPPHQVWPAGGLEKRAGS